MEKKIQLKTIEDVKDFVNIVTMCNFDVDLESERYTIDGKSILGVISLNLSKPIKLILHSEECKETLEKLQRFIVE